MKTPNQNWKKLNYQLVDRTGTILPHCRLLLCAMMQFSLADTLNNFILGHIIQDAIRRTTFMALNHSPKTNIGDAGEPHH